MAFMRKYSTAGKRKLKLQKGLVREEERSIARAYRDFCRRKGMRIGFNSIVPV